MLDQIDRDDRWDLGMAGWLGFQLYRVALARGLRERGFTDLRDALIELHLHEAPEMVSRSETRSRGVS